MLGLLLLSVGAAVLLVYRGIVWRINKYIQACNARGETLTEDEPAGFHKGNWFLWQAFKWIFLPILWWHRRHYRMFGRENLETALQMAAEGYEVVFIINHRASPDVWMPQFILWHNGYHTLAEKKFFYIIGLKFFNRYPLYGFAIQCKDRAPIVPPTMVPEERPERGDKAARENFLKQLRIVKSVNDPAREVILVKLADGRWLFIAPEGTRQDDGKMHRPDEGFMTLFGDLRGRKLLFLPVGVSKTKEMWEKNAPASAIKWPTDVAIHIERPITSDQLLAEATVIADKFGIKTNRAAVDLLMYAIAHGLQANGHSDICGDYNLDWPELIKLPITGKKREGHIGGG